MFTEACFIRKNTNDLRNGLNKMGKSNCSQKNFPILICNFEIYYGVHDFEESIDTLILNGFIDCGINEELFLAIAALRDDTDIDNHQWFIHQDGSFCKCECDSKIDMWGDFEESESYPRKATVSELIELFKK